MLMMTTAALFAPSVAMADVVTAATVQPDGLPALSEQGIARVVILCLVVDQTSRRMAIQNRLSRQFQRIAAQRAPVGIAAIGFGDPTLLARDTLGVLVHAAVQRTNTGDSLIISARPYRSDPLRSQFFGATPVSIPVDRNGAVPDAAIAALLDQILPWRH